MIDYEFEYHRNRSACGQPFPEMLAFFKRLGEICTTVLDFGCGQGRDALMIARLGHRVHGIDTAPAGIQQMRDVADAELLEVTGEVADIRTYDADRNYDIVILDRVIHMLSGESEKKKVLGNAAKSVAPSGYVLVVETPSNLPLVERFFERKENWEPVLRKKGFRFYRRAARAA